MIVLWDTALAIAKTLGWVSLYDIDHIFYEDDLAAQIVRRYHWHDFVTIMVAARPGPAAIVAAIEDWSPVVKCWSWHFAHDGAIFAFKSEQDAVEFRLRLP